MEQEAINNTDAPESINWMARTGLNEESLSAAVEALIYVTDKPMSLNKIRDAIDEEIPLKAIHQAIEKLQKEYEEKHHGLRLQEVAMGYQFRTKATYAKIVQNHLKISVQALTPATLEVLAVICYKQPISKSNIDLMRGVDSSHLIKTLMDKKLVATNGRAEDEPGKPSLYITTSEFLEFFNLSSIENLPKYAELEELAELDVLKGIPPIKDVLLNDDSKNIFDFDDLVEIDEIAGKIKDIQVDTDFTKQLRNPIKEIITINEENQEPVKSTIHLSAFDILENFISKPVVDNSEHTPAVDSLKEMGEKELEALLDAAFDKLTDIENKTNNAREKFLKDGEDNDRLN